MEASYTGRRLRDCHRIWHGRWRIYVRWSLCRHCQTSSQGTSTHPIKAQAHWHCVPPTSPYWRSTEYGPGFQGLYLLFAQS